jgi:hypothetical protein
MKIRKNKKRIKEHMEVVTQEDIYLRNSMTKALGERNLV